MEHVILLHGIWMRGFTLSALAGRLREVGFSTEVFEYASVEAGPKGSAGRLRERMRAHGDARVHLVGHSLGGLVALHAVDGEEELPEGRVLCLGSPLIGSAAARGLDRYAALHWMLGASREMLCSGFERWSGPRDVGVIAGTRAMGLGNLFGHFDGPHDGTVSVAETQLPGIADHYSLPVSHSGLVFSQGVAALSAGFLRDGRFPREAGQTE